MNKTDRLALIRNRYFAKVGAPIAGLLPVGKREIRAVVRETVVPVVVDEEEAPIASNLRFDKIVEKKEKETDYLLTAKERAMVKPILKKVAQEVTIEGDSGEIFPAQDVPEYVPIISLADFPELNAEIDRETAAVLFESDYDENPIDFDPSPVALVVTAQTVAQVAPVVRGPLSLAENAEDSFELVEFTQDISEDPSEFEMLRQRVLAMAR